MKKRNIVTTIRKCRKGPAILASLALVATIGGSLAGIIGGVQNKELLNLGGEIAAGGVASLFASVAWYANLFPKKEEEDLDKNR